MHHRNLGKKHLRAIKFENLPLAPFTDIIIDDKIIGNMRSSCGDIGLAVMKDDFIQEIKTSKSAGICVI
jgi:hypothetical protein